MGEVRRKEDDASRVKSIAKSDGYIDREQE